MSAGVPQRLRALADRLARWGPVAKAEWERERTIFLANRSDNLFFGVYASWQEAEVAAAACGAVGYDHDSTVHLYETRVRKDQHDYPSVYWLQRSMLDGLRSVFDVGGNIGIKYLAFRDALQRWPDLAWTVQDVPAVVAHGRKLALARGDGSTLRFTDQLAHGDGCDVLFASGVLQYLPLTLGELLASWQKRPKRIVINTTPIHHQHGYFTVNSIWTAYCPYRVQTQAELVRPLAELGYRVKESWVNPDKPLRVPGHPGHSLQHYGGLCLDLAT